jgi:hypothetical protein
MNELFGRDDQELLSQRRGHQRIREGALARSVTALFPLGGKKCIASVLKFVNTVGDEGEEERGDWKYGDDGQRFN